MIKIYESYLFVEQVKLLYHTSECEQSATNPGPATFEQALRHEEAAKQHVKNGKGKEGSERYEAEKKDRRLTSNVEMKGVCNGGWRTKQDIEGSTAWNKGE